MNLTASTISRMTRRAALALGIAASALTLTAPASHATTAPPRCTIKAPVTAAGYTAMFARINPTVWGAADTALTVHLPGKAVWLFSDTAYAKPGVRYDTLSGWARFTHSSAIVQTAGCLRVNGAQVLPNEGGLIYWIDSGTPMDASHIRVIGYEMNASTNAATGRFRAAQVGVWPDGAVRFQRWLGYVPAPKPSPLVKNSGLMGNSVSYQGHVIASNILTGPTDEYTYSPQLHPELGLAGGKTLLSLAVGWLTTTPTWQQARPIFREVRL